MTDITVLYNVSVSTILSLIHSIFVHDYSIFGCSTQINEFGRNQPSHIAKFYVFSSSLNM